MRAAGRSGEDLSFHRCLCPRAATRLRTRLAQDETSMRRSTNAKTKVSPEVISCFSWWHESGIGNLRWHNQPKAYARPFTTLIYSHRVSPLLSFCSLPEDQLDATFTMVLPNKLHVSVPECCRTPSQSELPWGNKNNGSPHIILSSYDTTSSLFSQCLQFTASSFVTAHTRQRLEDRCGLRELGPVRSHHGKRGKDGGGHVARVWFAVPTSLAVATMSTPSSSLLPFLPFSPTNFHAFTANHVTVVSSDCTALLGSRRSRDEEEEEAELSKNLVRLGTGWDLIGTAAKTGLTPQPLSSLSASQLSLVSLYPSLSCNLSLTPSASPRLSPLAHLPWKARHVAVC